MFEAVIPLMELETVLKRLQAGTAAKAEWSALAGSVQVRMDEAEIRFTTTDGCRLVSVAIAADGGRGTFPEWSRIVPEVEPVATVQISVNTATHALKSLKPAAGTADDHVTITATAGGMITIAHVNSGMAVTIAGTVTGAGDEPMNLARVNRAWLLGMWASLDSPEALLEFRGVMAPISIIPRGYFGARKDVNCPEFNSPGSRVGRSGHHDGDVTIIMPVRQ